MAGRKDGQRMASPNRIKSDWIELLQAANISTSETPAKGYRPMSEWLEEFEIGETTWRRKIPLLEQQGVMVKGFYRIHENGRTTRKPFWKYAKADKRKVCGGADK